MEANVRMKSTRWAAASALLCGGGTACFLLPKLAWSVSWVVPILGHVAALFLHLLFWMLGAACLVLSLIFCVMAFRRAVRWPVLCLGVDVMALRIMLWVPLSWEYPAVERLAPWLSRLTEGLLGWMMSGAVP